jgi:hypothetical protein
MNTLMENPTSLGYGIQGPPDAFVVTTCSAVPIAAALQGYLESSNANILPSISDIHMNRESSERFFYRNRSLPGGIEGFTRHSDEIDRLRGVLEGARHVTVVEQYMISGQTMKCAAALLYAAGVAQVSGMRGKWYEHYPPRDVSTDNLRERDGVVYDFMYGVGAHAYAMSRESVTA